MQQSAGCQGYGENFPTDEGAAKACVAVEFKGP
jgi:hypothetical protein